MVKQNRHNLLAFYKKSKNIATVIVLHDKQDECNETNVSVCDHDYGYNSDNLEDSNEPQSKKKKFGKKKKEIKFQVSLWMEQWYKVSPVEKKYQDGRESETLRPGGTDMLTKEMWKKKKLPCCYNFHRHSVGCVDAYIRISGYCKTCNVKLTAICSEKPVPNEGAKFIVTTVDSRGILHTEKRRLAGPERVVIKEQIENRKPKIWRREAANREMRKQYCILRCNWFSCS